MTTIADQLTPDAQAALDAAGGDPGDLVLVDVSAEQQNRLLRLLLCAKPLEEAAAVAGLDDDVAHRLAADAGWPDLSRVDQTFRRAVRPVTLALPRTADPSPEAEPVDHAALARVEELQRALLDHDPAAAARLAGAWTTADLWEAACAAAALLPPGLDAERALEWADVPPQEWSEEVLVVHWNRWEAGCRDVTARAAANEHARRAKTRAADGAGAG